MPSLDPAFFSASVRFFTTLLPSLGYSRQLRTGGDAIRTVGRRPSTPLKGIRATPFTSVGTSLPAAFFVSLPNRDFAMTIVLVNWSDGMEMVEPSNHFLFASNNTRCALFTTGASIIFEPSDTTAKPLRRASSKAATTRCACSTSASVGENAS